MYHGPCRPSSEILRRVLWLYVGRGVVRRHVRDSVRERPVLERRWDGLPTLSLAKGTQNIKGSWWRGEDCGSCWLLVAWVPVGSWWRGEDCGSSQEFPRPRTLAGAVSAGERDLEVSRAESGRAGEDWRPRVVIGGGVKKAGMIGRRG